MAPILARSGPAGIPGRGDTTLPQVATPAQPARPTRDTVTPPFQPRKRGVARGIRSINSSPVPPCPPPANRYTKKEVMTTVKTQLGTMEPGLLCMANMMPTEKADTERSMTASVINPSPRASTPNMRVTRPARTTAHLRTFLLIDASCLFMCRPSPHSHMLDRPG